MPRAALMLAVLLLIAGCPATSDPTDPNDPNAVGDPNEPSAAPDPNDPNAVTDPNDPNAAADPLAWLDGSWSAVASSLTDRVTGAVTIKDGRVTVWRGSTGSAMTIIDSPRATGGADQATISVTVSSLTSGAMLIRMDLLRTGDDQATGSIFTFSLTSEPFAGTVTLTRT